MWNDLLTARCERDNLRANVCIRRLRQASPESAESGETRRCDTQMSRVEGSGRMPVREPDGRRAFDPARADDDPDQQEDDDREDLVLDSQVTSPRCVAPLQVAHLDAGGDVFDFAVNARPTEIDDDHNTVANGDPPSGVCIRPERDEHSCGAHLGRQDEQPVEGVGDTKRKSKRSVDESRSQGEVSSCNW